MLPRSFFSASSLKSPQANNGGNNSGDELTTPQGSNSTRRISKRRNSFAREIKKEPTSPLLYPNESDMEMEGYVSANSTSPLGSSDEENEVMPSNLQDLMLQLRQQQEKQARYIEKTRKLSQKMQETSLRIAQLTGMTLPRPSSSGSKSVRKSISSSSPFRPVSRNTDIVEEEEEVEQQQPVRRPMYAKRSAGPPQQQELPAAKVQRRNTDIDAPIALARKTGPLANPRRTEPSTPTRASTPGASNRVQNKVQIKLASQNVCDLYLNRNQDVKMTAFAKKPRSLLFNIAENDPSMKDLLISTTLKGDMQFWNASTRSLITNVGPERLHKNGWIEELCWVAPTTLAFCTSQSKQETKTGSSVHLTHIKKVKRDDVDIQLQSFSEKPHQKEIIAISPVQIGQTGSVGVERASFVTGGTDHLVCLWDMIRDSPQEDFSLTDVNTLGINHTNSVQSLCYDSYHDKLYTGGADSKLFTYDMLSQKTISELKIGNRVNHIQKNPKDQNLLMISQAQTSDQFAIYDQRMHGVRGLQLSFGFSETENLSRYIKPDWQQEGYIVVCGSQSESKVHFWDIRYSGVGRGPCFSLLTQGSTPSRILRTLFVPNQNALVSVSSTRTMTWTDYSVQPNSKINSI